MPGSGRDDASSGRARSLTSKEQERRRLAEALRANLGRRKAQKRARIGSERSADSKAEDTPGPASVND